MECQMLKIEDGTIDHPLEMPSTGYSVAQKKRWGAIVWRDKSKPGGLGRNFLENRNDGKILLIGNVKPGNYLEIAVKLETYSRYGRQAESEYLKVVEITNNEMLVLPVAKKEIPPLQEQTFPSGEDREQAVQTKISQQKEQITELQNKILELEEKIKKAKNISNHLNRKFKEGKMTDEILGHKLNELNDELRQKRGEATP